MNTQTSCHLRCCEWGRKWIFISLMCKWNHINTTSSFKIYSWKVIYSDLLTATKVNICNYQSKSNVESSGHEVNIGKPPSSPSSLRWQFSPRRQRGPPSQELLGTKGKDKNQLGSMTLEGVKVNEEEEGPAVKGSLWHLDWSDDRRSATSSLKRSDSALKNNTSTLVSWWQPF